MTPEQAGELVVYLTAAFPRDAIEDETFRVFTTDIALLADYDIAYEAVRELARGEERFPTIRLVREAYQSVQRRRASDRAETHGLEAAKAGPIPEWVHVWWWAREIREVRETRFLPQMVDPENGLPMAGPDDYMTPSDYAALHLEWQQAGSPRLAARDLPGSVGRRRQD